MNIILKKQKRIMKESYGSMGYGMNWNAKLEMLQQMTGNGSITVRDYKGALMGAFGATRQATLFGTLGRGTKIVFFKKEEFKPELAPKSATIEYLTIEEKDYVKMVY